MTPSEGVGPFDVAVIGAGPAGLAAAGSAVAAGAQVALVDMAPRPGGQYWRHRDGDHGARHPAWPACHAQRAGVDAARAAGSLTSFAGTQVWHVERTADGFAIHALADGAGIVVRSRTLVVATGAY